MIAGPADTSGVGAQGPPASPPPISGSLVVVQVVVEVLNKILILVEEMLIQILHLMDKQALGGGGGGRSAESNGVGHGAGGSGVVILRYQIGRVQAAAKATGGAISYYNSGSGMKTIHTFKSSGTFATEPNWSATNVEYVIVAGGGGGYCNDTGGGGGADIERAQHQ